MSANFDLEQRRSRGLGEMFRALRHRNFLLFWSGAFLSNTGTWMQAVAQGWLVLQLTNSPFWLGFDGFMATVPGLLLTLAGGVFADLVDRRTLLIYTQIVAGLAALTLGILVATNVVHVWMILSLSFVTGCCLAIAGPSYMALVFDLVDREDLANAIALNSTQFQLSRVLGPVAAAIGFKLFGIAGCFFANGLSFAAVCVGLAMVRFEEAPHVSAPYLSMTPVFARDVFHLGETGLALLMGMAGAGALFGALFLAYMGDLKHKGKFVLAGAFGFAVCLICFSLSSVLILSLIFLFALGFGIVCSVALSNTLLQT